MVDIADGIKFGPDDKFMMYNFDGFFDDLNDVKHVSSLIYG